MTTKKQQGEDNLLSELKEATKDLLFMSESDYPFEVFRWDKAQEVARDFLRKEAGKGMDDTVEEKSVDEFFKQAVSIQDWHGKEEKATAQKYQALVKLLKERLTNLKVYRVGSVNITVFILGKDQGGDWVGLATQVVET